MCQKIFKIGVADFETTTDPNDCRVWAWAIADVENQQISCIGDNITDFINQMFAYDRLYFHNLKFDASFIIDYLLKNGWLYNQDARKLDSYQFSILRSDKNVMYSMTIKNKTKKLEIYDSLKLLPFSVSSLAKSFNLKLSKLEIDYNEYRPVGHKLTQLEIDYISADVLIVAQVLKIMLDDGMSKMTIGGNAMDRFRQTIPSKLQAELFPKIPLEADKYLRKSYKGGFTWVNPLFKEQDVGFGLVYDNNSMHPSQLRYKPMPVGLPEFYTGKYQYDSEYPLYVQKIVLSCKIKHNHIPCINTEHSFGYMDAEYLTETNQLELVVTSVDLKLIFDQYDILNIIYVDGFKFKSKTGLFNQYIDKYIKIKAESKGAQRQIAKLMLNNIYGKFGTRLDQISVEPYLDNGVVKYRKIEQQNQAKPEYLPIAIFTTAYSRDTVIRAGQPLYNRLCYVDTDSLHIIGLDVPDLDIHPTRLGAWDNESTFVKARFLRCKRYIEYTIDPDADDIIIKQNVKCGGMPDNVKQQVTWDNFHRGSVFSGKLMPKTVAGGIVLVETTYKMT